MSNPRNKPVNTSVNTEAKANTEAKSDNTFNPDGWKFLTLGSLALRNGRDLVREGDISFVINARNAELIRDAAQFVLDNPTDSEGKDQRVSINASPFYEDSVSDKVMKYFTHRLYISADTVAKWGKQFSAYVKNKAA